MTNGFLPQISKKDLENKDSWDFLNAIVNVYWDWVTQEWPDFVYDNLSDEQDFLFCYCDLVENLTTHGFVYWIYYGARWFFGEAFIQKLYEVWLEKTVKNIEKAKKIFEKYEEKFANVRRGDREVYLNLCKEYPEFKDCDNEYCEINDAEVDILAKYVRENISDFIEVTE